jgi:gliding motility-associatede transport system auxiliary component
MSDETHTPHDQESIEDPMNVPHPSGAPDPSGKRSFRSLLSGALALLQRKGMAFLLLGVLLLIAASTWYAIARGLDGWVRGLAIGGLVAIAIYALLRPQDLERAFGGRSVRYGSSAVVLSVVTIGIVVLLNYLSTRTYKRFDVTEGDLHSLSPQSIQIVSALDSEIEVIGVYPGGQDQVQFEKWIDEYRAHTSQIRYRTIDPLRQPGEADRLGWDAYGGGLVVQRDTRSQQVNTPDEQDITSALLKVSRDTAKVVYFIAGHNEPSPTAYENDGYGQIGMTLENNNYTVRTLNLAITGTVPSDAALVVLAGLKTPLLEEEKAPLRNYLDGGGKALIMVDPGLETGINDVLAPWQVRVENKLVVDLRRSLSGDAITPVVDRYAFSQITKDLPMVALPLACPIVASETGAPGITFTPLGVTSDQAWADADVEGTQELQYDADQDLAGPLTLIASIEPAQDGAAKTRMVLIGDSDLLLNGTLSQIPNGRYLFLNAVNWLAEEESLIAIGPKTNVPRNIQMTVVQEGVVCFGALILIPALIAIAGIAVWFKRR